MASAALDAPAEPTPATIVAGEAGWQLIVRRQRLLLGPLPAAGDWPSGAWLAEIARIEDARALLGPADPQARMARSAVFWQSRQLRARARLRLGMHDRGEEYIFADGPLCAADADGHRRHFPLHLKSVQLDELRLGAGETLDVSARAEDWPGLDVREELYLRLSVGTLVLGAGSTLMVRGNVCALAFDTIRFEGKGESPTILIGGADHAPYSSTRREAARPGISGLAGSDGRGGAATPIALSPFGPRVSVAAGSPDGADGVAGSDGSAGSDGQSGSLAMLADIRLGALEGFGRTPLRILGQAGAGAAGAAGGAGGDGGRGGGGADGLHDPALLVPAGAGGRGGDGGAGGHGGDGGHGGLASNIFVTLRRTDADAVALVSQPSIGGAAGTCGQGGRGGAGGPGGGLVVTSPVLRGEPAPAPAGTAGRAGSDGSAGRPGRSREGPPIWRFLTD